MSTAEQDTVRHSAATFTRLDRGLLSKALPDPADTSLFNKLLAEARSLGMDWNDGLVYVIDRRRTLLN